MAANNLSGLTLSTDYNSTACSSSVWFSNSSCECYVCWNSAVIFNLLTVSVLVLVDVVTLMITIQFALKSLTLRNAYVQATDGARKWQVLFSAEVYFIFGVLCEIVVHISILFFALGASNLFIVNSFGDTYISRDTFFLIATRI